MKYSPEKYEQVMMDSRYMDVGGLPSNFKDYSFSKLYIRPFELSELKLISRAVTLGELGPLLRALDLTITEDVNDLTVGDYYYLLMWQKVHSYTKTPLMVEWHCPETVWRRREDGHVFTSLLEEHQKEIEAGKEYIQEPCDTTNTEPITMPAVEIVSLEDDFELPEKLSIPKVRTMEDVNKMLTEPDMAMLVPAIQWMPGSTMDDKMKFFEESGDMNLFHAAMRANKEIIHGIKQSTTLTCRRCRTRFPYKIDLEPLSFFQ